ncbi:MAG: PilW family protein [Proteobacteria bacterium]|nr:PilW family protein [Pseudomonadota bacterium]
MSKIMTRQFKQHGLSLIEIMVAITISMILLTGVVQLFISNKKTYSAVEELSRLQENARFAMEFISRDIRRAGFQGCRSRREIPSHIIANPGPTGDEFDVNTAISGEDNVSSVTDVVDGTDIISLQFGGSCGGTLTGNMDADNAQIHLTAPNTCNLDQGGLFMISDCESADIARISNTPCNADPDDPSYNCSSGTQNAAHANNVNISNRLSKAYQSDAEIFALISRNYSIRVNPTGNRALYRENIAGIAEELVEGIENMQALYGEDTTGDRVPNRYVPAHQISDMQDVVSVRISLLAYTIEDRVAQDNQTYAYEINDYNSFPTGTSFTAADKRIRRAFTSTISLRNRLK